MNRYIVPVVTGIIVAMVVGGGLGFLASAGGASPGMTPGLVGMIFGAFIAFIMASLAGNRKSPEASAEQKAETLRLAPPAGKAMLIVYRDGFMGRAAGLNVGLDGRTVAQLKSPRFTALVLDPGAHELELAFGALAAKHNRPKVEPFRAAAGEVVVYLVKISMGAMQNTIDAERQSTDLGLVAKLGKIRMVKPEA